MGKTTSLALVGLALVCAAPAWAGSHGNGADQRRAAAGLPPLPVKTHYTFCYGGSPKVVYFSPVLTQTAATTGVAFGHYLSKTYGATSNDGGQCITADAKADAAADKKKREGEFSANPTTPRKVVETKWGLAPTPGAPVSPTPPKHH